MRYDTPIYFQHRPKPTYNAETGNYTDGTLTETEVMASISATNVQTQHLIYGGIRETSKTIHLQNRFLGDFETIRIGNVVYHVDVEMPHRMKVGYIVSVN